MTRRESQNVLVTGASGFIGSAVAAALARQGHAVRLMDITGAATAHGRLMIGDVTRAEDCARACDGMDIVIHSAGVHHVDDVAAAPDRMLAVNVTGTINVVRGAAEAGARRVVFLSTAKVYGEPDELPSRESNPLRPLEAYAHAKIAAEEHCRAIQQETGMDIAVIRPFSVYGPGQDLHTGYVGMVIRALRGEVPLQLPADPDAVRDFVHIADVARLCALSATAPLPGYTVLNAGSGAATRLRDLVALAARITRQPLDARWCGPRESTIQRTHGCMAEARRVLGFSPRISLEEGLAGTIEWFLAPAAAGRIAL